MPEDIAELDRGGNKVATVAFLRPAALSPAGVEGSELLCHRHSGRPCPAAAFGKGGTLFVSPARY